VAWFKFLYDATTPQWSAFGRVAFIEAETAGAARALALDAAQLEYPESRILPYSFAVSTPAAAAAFAERRAAYLRWKANSAAGIPNTERL